MLTLIKSIGITDGTNFVSLSNISEGVDGSSTFGYSTEEGTMMIEDGQTVRNYIDHTLDIRVLASAFGTALLRQWMDSETPVYITAIGVDGFIVIGDVFAGEQPVLLTTAPYRNENREALSVMATKRTVQGNEGGLINNGFYAGESLMGMQTSGFNTYEYLLVPNQKETITLYGLDGGTQSALELYTKDASGAILQSDNTAQYDDTTAYITMQIDSNVRYVGYNAEQGGNFSNLKIKLGEYQ